MRSLLQGLRVCRIVFKRDKGKEKSSTMNAAEKQRQFRNGAQDSHYQVAQE